MAETLTQQARRALAASVAGQVIGPGDPDYDDARSVWNAMIDRRPAAVVRAAGIDDAAPVIAFAVEHGLPLAVRGGGHGVAGHGTVDDGIVLDLGACRGVRVDPEAATATVEPGARLADLDAATSPHGLAVPVGVISATGVVGLSLGGGFGWLTRRHGLSVDQLLAAELITADGTAVRADREQNPELLWALRGGGGNFGVITSLSFAAHPLPSAVLCANLVYARPHWAGALHAFARWARTVPDEMTSIITAIAPPPVWDMGTDPLIVIGCAWSGADLETGQGLLEELAAQAPPDGREVGPVAWPAWQSSLDALFPAGVRAYWKNTGFRELDDEVIAILCARAAEQTWQGTAFDIHHMGGAFARVPADDTAFPDRSSGFWLNVYGFWASPEDDERDVAFVRGLARDMAGHATGAQYVNFLGQDADGGASPQDAWRRAAAVYGEQKLRRLARVKHRFDPDNVFRLNHNIPPLPETA